MTHQRPAAEADAWAHSARQLAAWSPGQAWPEDPPEAQGVAADASFHREVTRRTKAVLRHWGLIESLLAAHASREPRPLVKAAVALTMAEVLSDPAAAPAAVVHHGVERAKAVLSVPEVGFMNAVLRRMVADLPAVMAAAGAEGTVEAIARRWSHPAWLVARWDAERGREATVARLEWDQTVPGAWVRLRPGAELPAEVAPHLGEPDAAGFRPVKAGADWAAIVRAVESGLAYVQNPGAGAAALLLAAQPGEVVLDLCAAPGGKSLMIGEALGGAGLLVAVDRGATKVQRLAGNLRQAGLVAARVLSLDVLSLEPQVLAAADVPTAYDAVLLDVPCSNTGVLQHKPEVKWRLREADLAALADLQGRLLLRAAACVRPGGRLVYSTCSLEPEENRGVIEAFLAGASGEWSLEATRSSDPAVDRTDGAGAFLLRRAG